MKKLSNTEAELKETVTYKKKVYLKKNFEIASINVFRCACFQGHFKSKTLRFCNKSSVIWEDSRVRE